MALSLTIGALAAYGASAAGATLLTAAAYGVGVGLATQGLVEQKAAGRAARRFAQQEAEATGRIAAEQRHQFALQQRITDIKNARERAQIAREARKARGQIINLGATTGTLQSTGVLGGVASVQSQEASISGQFGAVSEAQGLITESQQRVASESGIIGQSKAGQIGAQTQASEGAALFNLGTDIFAGAGGWKTIFDTKKTT